MDQMPGQFPPPPASETPPLYQSPGLGGHFPLDIGRTFRLAWSIYRFRFWTFAGIALLVMVPVTLFVTASELLIGNPTATLSNEVQVMVRGGAPNLPASLWPLVGLSVLVSAVSGLFTQFVSAAVTKAAVDTYSGREAKVADSLRFGLRRLSAVAGAYLITFLATFGVIAVGATLATLAFMMTSSNGRFVPGPGVFAWLLVFVATIAALLFVSVRWALTIPAIVVEGSGAMDALRRSWHLVSGSSWRVLGYVIAFSFVVGVIGALLTLPLVIFSIATSAQSGSFVPNPTVTVVIAFITTLVGTVLAPLVSIAMLLLYFDLRFRAGEQVPQPGLPSAATEPPPGPPTF